MRKHYVSRAVPTLLIAGLVAFAQPAAAGDWEVTLSPYAWLLALNGDSTVRGNYANIDASFKDIVDESDSLMAFNSDIMIRNGRFGFYLGPSYARLEVDNVANGTVNQADVTNDLLFVDAAATYRVVDWPLDRPSGDGDMAATMDVYGGVRYTRLGLELDFDNLGSSDDSDKDWWDPIVGAQSKIDLTPHWFLLFHGDVGGFSAGSDFSANGSAAIGYGFKICGHDFAVRAGYRAIYQDYHEGTGGAGAHRFEWDMTVHGPTLGLMTSWR